MCVTSRFYFATSFLYSIINSGVRYENGQYCHRNFSDFSSPDQRLREYRFSARILVILSRRHFGVVDSIEMTRGSGGGTGAGAIIGGVVGGVLGHQVGSGTGKDVATVAGVVGGAVAGNEVEKSNKQQDSSRIRVRLDNGGYLTVTQQGTTELRVGDRVRIENDRVSRY